MSNEIPKGYTIWTGNTLGVITDRNGRVICLPNQAQRFWRIRAIWYWLRARLGLIKAASHAPLLVKGADND